MFLSVGPRDPFGYHPLRTTFQAVGLEDDLYIETTDGETEISFNWPWIPEQNTISKALALVSEIATVPPLKIEVTKRIPIESGLGGGSSNAAGILRAVQKLTGVGSTAELHSVAAAVGTDVPFFLLGGRAQGIGYGDHLMALRDEPREWLLIARPEVGCPTPEMYAKLDEQSYEWKDFPEEDILYNDFERVAPCECLDLIERVCALGAKDAGLSGSGSSVFGRFESEPLAEIACERLWEDFEGDVWVVPTLTRRESLQMSEKPSELRA
ncbi:MAG: 4-diphosphocytidyl-2-C-methyl-D-erythritol kinase [Fimbriimonadaceae bacterium]|jgi:4-diphosphocytidyl-2-C-methyl-D-erythritol kinase|nr:4-diphosphocytidyl-2-C-methyl-D-erythritol kinase [Fimbriimonadaceae bacterium]